MKTKITSLMVMLVTGLHAGEGWLTNIEKAQEQAKAEKKLVLLEFTGSDWCPPCKALKKNIFDTEKFKAYAKKNLVLVELDFPRDKSKITKEQSVYNAAQAKKYVVKGYPTVLLLDAGGKELMKKVGFSRGTSAERYIEALKDARRTGLTDKTVPPGSPVDEASELLARAHKKYKIGEEAEAIDLGLEAAKLGSAEARAIVAKWMLERFSPKKGADATRSIKEAQKSETDSIHMIEQEIASLLSQCQASAPSEGMTPEQMQMMMQMMQMMEAMGMKPGQKPGQQPGMNNSGGTTNKKNEATPGNVAGGEVDPDNRVQKLAGRNSQLPKEFQGQLKGFFKGVDQLRKKK
jgi:thioredoxin-related protein